MPQSALIGHTGFIGGNLARQHSFDDHFHSANINDIRGRSYDLVVCSGISAVKWKANRFPDDDIKSIELLLGNLDSVEAARVVLISTVDVFADVQGPTEACDPHRLTHHPYGVHRLYAEDRIRDRFPVSHVVRLPGMFGPGLKKNALFDLIHRNAVEQLHPDSSFQYYDVRRLWRDIQVALGNDLPLLHLATEPVSTRALAQRFFSDIRFAAHAEPPVHYDMRTQYAPLFGSTGNYCYSLQQVECQIADWLASSQT